MDYIVYNINKKIQNNVKAFGVEGFFIFTLMGILIFCFILLIILNTFIHVILSTLISLVLFIVSGGIATYLSKKMGIRGLIKKIGSIGQAQSIYCKSISFKIKQHETININETIND